MKLSKTILIVFLTLGISGKSFGNEIFSLWIPMCFLFDPSVDEKKANESIKEMVKAYGKCRIGVKPFAFTVKANYPQDPFAVKELAKASCPLSEVFGTRGAIQMQLNSSAPVKTMCQDSQAKGCSSLCSPLSFSLLEPNAAPSSVIHESLHANCCGASCVDEGKGAGVDAGFGIELARLKQQSQTTFEALNHQIEMGEISEAACESLRAGAGSRDIADWKEAVPEKFYTRQSDPTKQRDITTGKSFFEVTPKPIAALPVPVTAEEPAAPSASVWNRLTEKLNWNSEPVAPKPRAPASYGFKTGTNRIPEEPVPKTVFPERSEDGQPGEPRPESGSSLRRSSGSARAFGPALYQSSGE